MMRQRGGGGYTTNSYLKVLEKEMSKYFKPDRTFMWDNVSIYTVKKIKKWCEDSAISLFNWTPYLPDMNPIEHVWTKMKEWICKHHPELLNMGKSQETYDQLARAIEEAWNVLDQEYIDNLIRGMSKRVEALRKAKGWHTKY